MQAYPRIITALLVNQPKSLIVNATSVKDLYWPVRVSRASRKRLRVTHKFKLLRIRSIQVTPFRRSWASIFLSRLVAFKHS